MAGPGGGLIALFLTFHIAGGIVGLPLVFVSILATKQISRHPTLLNFCATWTLASIVYTLLLFAGQQGNAHPPVPLCKAQASMVTGVFPMTSVAGVSLVAHIWHGLTSSQQRVVSQYSYFAPAPHSMQKARLGLMIVAPYVVFIAFTLSASVVSHNNPGLVTSSDQFFYCNLNSGAFTILVPAFTTVAMAVILMFEVFICIEIYKSGGIRLVLSRSPSSFFLLRLAGYTIYACIALIVSALFLAKSGNYAPFILQSTLPFAVFVFIGTQKEVRRIWGRWLRPCLGGPKDDFDFDAEIQHRRSRSTTGLMKEATVKAPPIKVKKAAAQPVRGARHLNDQGEDEFTAEIFKSTVPSNIGLRAERVPMPGYDVQYGQTTTTTQEQHAPASQQQDAALPPVPKPLPSNPTYNYMSNVDHNQETIISTQKQTIARLLEENGFMKKSLDRMKDAEKSLHKTQNLLVTERRNASQLRSYTNQMESDLQNQSNIINNLLVKNKELEDKCKHQESDLRRITKENKSLSDALQHSVKNEMHWKDEHGKAKMENTKLVAEVKNLKSERDVLLDIWSTLESPVDWEMQKGGRADARKSPQHAFPELAQKMRQRASQPNIQHRALSRIQAKQIRRLTEKPGAGVVDNLDRLRPKLLAIGGKMELSEKVSTLEELVREQTSLIEELEAIIVEERQERFQMDEEGTNNWPIPSSIASSMIAERSRDSRKS